MYTTKLLIICIFIPINLLPPYAAYIMSIGFMWIFTLFCF
jgi:hypothetical protein